ncbi:MAG: glutamine amidotransferase [Clostridia bacterium]|nr:glutamine amidotransferase [Clostridia bacterium]
MIITIANLYPDLLNLYGDFGNIRTLCYRLNERGYEAKVTEYFVGDAIDFDNTDIIYLGGGGEKELIAVNEELCPVRDKLKSYVEDGGVMLATCSGFEILGKTFETESGVFDGLGILNISSSWNKDRFIGDVILDSTLVNDKIVGFENHNTRIEIGSYEPLGIVQCGCGNDGINGREGVCYKNLIATFLHGPLLPKNPSLADYILFKALERKGDSTPFISIDDTEENAAREYMLKKIMK